MDWFAPIFGRHYFVVTSLENAIGHFNVHLSESLLVHANEAIWGGDKRSHGRLKALITDPTTDVTAKGKDTIMIDNFKRWVFASNADHPVPIDKGDRRFVVFEVSAARKGQTAYYKALEDLRDRGPGPAALMYDLQQEDLSAFHPAADRPTSGLAKYKTQTASAFDQWLRIVCGMRRYVATTPGTTAIFRGQACCRRMPCTTLTRSLRAGSAAMGCPIVCFGGRCVRLALSFRLSEVGPRRARPLCRGRGARSC